MYKLKNRTLSQTFLAVLFFSLISIAILNIIAFSFFYNRYFKIYLGEKLQNREKVTIEYINNLIERETLTDINSIFSDVELEFFEILELENWEIHLDSEKNVNIVVDFLVKSGVSLKYIEEVIPDNTLERVIELIGDQNSPESRFVNRILRALILSNIVILILWGFIIYKITSFLLRPVRIATQEIKNMRLGDVAKKIEYPRKDEVGLLIQSINGLNKKLSLQENIRSRLLADISHELKTPISSIRCYLEWIADKVIKLDETTLNSITHEMNRLTTLVNKIMEFEKFENSELILNKSSVQIYALIDKIRKTQKPELLSKSQKIIIKWSRNIEILCDEDLIKQLVYNLIQNFKKYAWNNTILTIQIHSNSLLFSDNGEWIRQKDIPFLFEKFYQGKIDRSWEIDTRGIGVWLSVVKKILDAHNWNVEIDSDTGKWFSFYITF